MSNFTLTEVKEEVFLLKCDSLYIFEGTLAARIIKRSLELFLSIRNVFLVLVDPHHLTVLVTAWETCDLTVWSLSQHQV